MPWHKGKMLEIVDALTLKIEARVQEGGRQQLEWKHSLSSSGWLAMSSAFFPSPGHQIRKQQFQGLPKIRIVFFRFRMRLNCNVTSRGTKNVLESKSYKLSRNSTLWSYSS